MVEDNMRVVRRGFDRDERDQPTRRSAGAPAALRKRQPADHAQALPGRRRRLPPIPTSTASGSRPATSTSTGKGNDNLADPFIGASLIPAATGVFRDMTGIRFEHPEWIAENCTACGKCYTVCPDSAIPGLVSSVAEVFDTARRTASRRGGEPTQLLRAPARTIEHEAARAVHRRQGRRRRARRLIDEAIADDRRRGADADASARSWTPNSSCFKAELGDFQFAHHAALLDAHGEEGARAAAACFSITVNPYTCKGCMRMRQGLRGQRVAAGRRRPRTPSTTCAATGISGSTCRRRRKSSAASTTSMRGSARWKRCCSTRATTSRWSAATALASAAAKRPRPPVHQHRRGADAAAREGVVAKLDDLIQRSNSTSA